MGSSEQDGVSCGATFGFTNLSSFPIAPVWIHKGAFKSKRRAQRRVLPPAHYGLRRSGLLVPDIPGDPIECSEGCIHTGVICSPCATAWDLQMSNRQ